MTADKVFSLASHPPSPSHFRQVAEVIMGNTPVAEYLSDHSGIRVLIATVEGPLVDGIFVVPTEVHDDDGCAHALEHLIFLGSERYPHSQVLDAMASRCLAEGTNAWTETDHTAFTLTTAGSDGFLNLLPVYLDHLLHPTLSDHAFITEVHHVNAVGKNDGVVYSEMRDFEHNAQCIVERTLREALYPSDCGYRYETGGRLEPLRQLTNEKIKQFHKKFYRWDNLSLIVVGTVPIPDLLGRISDYELSDPSSFTTNPTTREQNAPWQSVVLRQEILEPISVKFPSHDADDDVGEMLWGWRGPEWFDVLERHVLGILGEYLTYSNASPLQKALVEIKDPIAGSVEFEEEPFKSTVYALHFLDVPREAADRISPVVNKTLKSLAMNGFDMDLIKATIERLVALFQQVLEENPGEGYSQPLIEYVVNCPTPNPKILKELWDFENQMLNILVNKPQEFWREKLQQYFLIAKPVKVTGIPDCKLAKRLDSEEKRLIQEQMKAVNDNGGVEVINNRLSEARAYHDTKPPLKLIQTVPVAQLNSVRQFNFRSISNFEDPSFTPLPIHNKLESLIQNQLNDIPFPVHFCGGPSEFAELRAIVRIPDLKDYEVTEEEGSLIQLLIELIFETHVGTEFLEKSFNNSQRNHIIDHEAFSQLLISHLTDHSSIQGVSGAPASSTVYPELITVSVSCKNDKIVEASELLLAALRSAHLTSDRVLSIARQMLAVSVRKRRQGKTIASQIQLGLQYERNCLRMLSSLPVRQSTLRCVIASPSKYLPKLIELYEKLFGPQLDMLVLQVISSEKAFLKFNTLSSNLKRFWKPNSNSMLLRPLSEALRLPQTSTGRIESNAPLPFGNGILSTSPSHDAATILISVPGALGQNHADNANLTVLCELMSSSEGPLFKAVRGGGFAYSVSMLHSLHSGKIFFQLLSASDPVAALNAGHNIIKAYAIANIGDQDLRHHIETIFESSKCTSLFHIIRSEATAIDYASERFNNILLGRPANYTEVLLQQIQNVTVDSLLESAKKYLSQFLEMSLCPNSYKGGKSVVVVTNKTNFKEIKDKLKAFVPFKVQSEDAELREVDFANFEAWVVTGDEFATDVLKPIKGEEELVDAYDGSDEEDSFEDDWDNEEMTEDENEAEKDLTLKKLVFGKNGDDGVKKLIKRIKNGKQEVPKKIKKDKFHKCSQSSSDEYSDESTALSNSPVSP